MTDPLQTSADAAARGVDGVPEPEPTLLGEQMVQEIDAIFNKAKRDVAIVYANAMKKMLASIGGPR